MSAQSPQEIINFLNKYNIAYIDQQTSIITSNTTDQLYNTFPNVHTYTNKTNMATQQLSQSSFDFLYKNQLLGDKINSKMPECYLVKDMIVEEGLQEGEGNDAQHPEGKNMLQNVLDTLAIHKQLSNKYILKLIHYQTFLKQTIIQSIQCQQNPCHLSHLQQKNSSHIHTQSQINQKQFKQKQTQIQQSYQQQSLTIPKSSRYLGNNKCNQYQLQQHNYQYGQNVTSDNIGQHNGSGVNNNTFGNTVVSTVTKTAIRAIYQYGKLTLKQEIDNRIASNTQFQQEELWAILATIVQALGYLQEEGIVYGVLGTDKIFINDSLVKILDPSATATDPLLIAQGRLYSPEILNDDQNIDMFKSDVYIAGLVALQCGLLIDLSKQPQQNLTKHIQNFSTIYSSQLVQLLQICLVPSPESRPNFEQLKQYLAKQLDMNDFESAYNSKGIKMLQPIPNDTQDHACEPVKQIQIQFQGCTCDVLFESIGEQAAQARRKHITQYQRAKIRYLGLYQHLQNQSPARRSFQPDSSNSGSGYKNNRLLQQTQQHRHTSSSPISTRRNSKKHSASQQHTNFDKLPNFNMAISQSVYTDQIIPITNTNGNTNMHVNNNRNKKYNDGYQKTNRKIQAHYLPQSKNNQYYNCNNEIKNKQNRNYGQQQQYINNNQYSNIYTNPNPNFHYNPHNIRNNNIQSGSTISMSDKIKKTKLIKQKLVKNQYPNQDMNINNNMYGKQEEQNTFGSLKNNKNAKNIPCNQPPQSNIHCVPNYHNNDTNRDNQIYKKGLSIQQQVDEQSQSSYLYYNNGSSKVSKKQQNNSMINSQASHKQNSNFIINSNTRRYEQQQAHVHCNSQPQFQTMQQQQQQQETRMSKNRYKLEDDQIFTDPNLLRTIKDDLARISTTKNVKLMGSGMKESNRWFK